MRQNAAILIFLALIAVLNSCKKEEKQPSGCLATDVIIRQIVNQAATIKNISGKFYIIEQNTIDTKLSPCYLAPEFQIDNLSVTIEGEVKSPAQNTAGPCCTENFVVTKISK